VSSPRTGLDENRFTETFVPPSHPHMHMPRRDFLKLLNFKDFQCCHVCGRKSYLLVDHDHRTHLVRGLLCDTCNRLTGRYESGLFVPSFVRAKIKIYLDNTPCQQLGMRYEYQYYYPEQKKVIA